MKATCSILATILMVSVVLAGSDLTKEERAKQVALVKHARKTFAKKNDTKYQSNTNLLVVANSIACFNLKRPTYTECKQLIACCDELLKADHEESVTKAIEGSKLLFQNERTMMEKGYRRYGRRWVTKEQLARIRGDLAERQKKNYAYVKEKRRKEAEKNKAEKKKETEKKEKLLVSGTPCRCPVCGGPGGRIGRSYSGKVVRYKCPKSHRQKPIR